MSSLFSEMSFALCNDLKQGSPSHSTISNVLSFESSISAPEKIKWELGQLHPPIFPLFANEIKGLSHARVRFHLG
jgi:hypothetical protein